MAKKTIDWTGEIDGRQYDFSYFSSVGKHVLMVNGAPVEFKHRFTHSVSGVDEPFQLDGKDVRLVVKQGMTRGKPDIVADGVFLQTGKPYRPAPGWAWLFYVIHFLMIIVLQGGALTFLVAFLGVAGTNLIAGRRLPAGVRALLCTAFALVLWFGYILIVGLIFAALDI